MTARNVVVVIEREDDAPIVVVFDNEDDATNFREDFEGEAMSRFGADNFHFYAREPQPTVSPSAAYRLMQQADGRP